MAYEAMGVAIKGGLDTCPPGSKMVMFSKKQGGPRCVAEGETDRVTIMPVPGSQGPMLKDPATVPAKDTAAKPIPKWLMIGGAVVAALLLFR